WGADRIEIEPTDNNLTHNYLVVLYPANVGDSMPETVAINAASGNMQGVKIDDKIIIFSNTEGKVSGVTYTVNGSGTVRHLICDVTAGVNYEVRQNGTLINTISSTTQSILYFTANLSGTDTFNIVQTGSADTTAPAAVGDLAASSGTNDGEIDLTWTAPGDDGTTGTATAYTIKYSTTVITNDSEFNVSSDVTGEPMPNTAGTAETMTVTGLSAGQTYYFAIKSVDEVPNTSAVSNSAFAKAQEIVLPDDLIAPAAVTDLAISSVTQDSMTLTWTAPGDDGTSGTALSYDLRYSTSNITEADWAAAIPVTGELTPDIAGTTQTMTVTGLGTGQTYYFTIKTSDETANISLLSNVASSTTTDIIVADTAAPSVSSTMPQSTAKNTYVDTNIQVVIKDDMSGVDKNTIGLNVNGMAIITNGVIQTYIDDHGGTVNYNAQIIEKSILEYVIIYDPAGYFKYKEVVSIAINACDIGGNSMTEYEYSFTIQKMLRGQNSNVGKGNKSKQAADFYTYDIMSDTDVIQDNSRIVVSNGGKNVFIVWEECGNDGDWDIYIVKSTDFGETFSDNIIINNDSENLAERHPAIALDNRGDVYVAWQAMSNLGDWDIYVAKLENGADTFSDSFLVYNDSGAGNQTLPTIDIGQPLTGDSDDTTEEANTVYLAWVDESTGRGVIYYTRTTADYSDNWYEFVQPPLGVNDDRWPQIATEPVLKLDNNADIYIAWCGINLDGTHSLYFDTAGGSNIDLGEFFGTDVVVSDAIAGQHGPDLAVAPNGNDVYVTWTKLNTGYANIYFSKYSYSQLVGQFLLDEETPVNENNFTEQTLGMYALRVDSAGDTFVARSEEVEGDWNIYLSGAKHTNYLFQTLAQFNDDEVQSTQSNPALAIDNCGHHYYLTWTDERNGSKEIYFCRNTFIIIDDIISQEIDNVTGGVVNTDSGEIPGIKVELNAGAIDVPILVTISRVIAPPELPDIITGVGNTIDFGPGGTNFNNPVIIELPYTNEDLLAAVVENAAFLSIYYYNLETSAWEEISGVDIDMVNQRVSFNTTHFSMYILGWDGEVTDVGDDSDTGTDDSSTDDDDINEDNGTVASSSGEGGGGGGGCFIATAAYGTPLAEELGILRTLRDKHLMLNKYGRKFVKAYYTYSPPVADFISKHKPLRSIIKLCLRPLIDVTRVICRQ
ncbi:MAG: CFI-box-CTERM domain-containing protein, partial [Candidatus Omnitrophota bacterium]